MHHDHRSRGRGRKRAARLCAREGCNAPQEQATHGRNRFCSIMCRSVDQELAAAQRVTELLGPTPVVAQLQAELASMADAWSRAQQLGAELREAALSVGFTDARWSEFLARGVPLAPGA